METEGFPIEKDVKQRGILYSYLFNLCAAYII